MPWRKTTAMIERIQFIKDYKRDMFGFSELCDHYGISRKTGYKWLNRFIVEGEEGLADRSRAPKNCPHHTDERFTDMLLEARGKWSDWGPRKLRKLLEKRYPDIEWPAKSTIGDILKRHDMVRTRPRRRKPGHFGRPNTPMDEPNAVWTADFKGEFKTLDGIYCYPLTIMDGYSRYLLGCQALDSTAHGGVQPVFEYLFREFGLPAVIRTDNGIPFATTAIRRLSRLHVWWLKLGISPELIQPAHPEQNGRHERMHRTLKAKTTRPPATNSKSQQLRFEHFQSEYNEIRPHEALQDETPASAYQSSSRTYPDTVPNPEYPKHFEIRRVSHNGGIRWASGWLSISHVLAEEYVGLEEVDDGVWAVYFGSILLGKFHVKELKLYGAYPYNRKVKV